MNLKGNFYDGIPSGLTPENLWEWQSKNAQNFEPALKWAQELDEDDLNKFRTDFADKAIDLNAQKEEMKEEIKILKKRVKGIEDEMAKDLKVIQDKQIEIVENGFSWKDVASRSLIWTNSQGIIVSVRPLEPHEMQMHIGAELLQKKQKAKKQEEQPQD